MGFRRRELVLGSAAAAALAACAPRPQAPAAKPGSDPEVRDWKMVTSWPPDFPGLGAGAASLAAAITSATDGRIRVTVYAGNELVAPFEVFDAVARGTAQMGHSASYYWQDRSPATPFFCAVPFGLNAQEMSAWLHHGGGLELWRELYAGFGLVPFAAGNTGVQFAGWFNREINGVGDLKGLKMRIPGLGGEVMARLGAVPVELPATEIFTALQSGAIDAAEWMGSHNDLAVDLFRVAKYCYFPGWQEPGPVLECTIRKADWEALPGDLQAIVSACCRAQHEDMLAGYTARNQQSLAQLVTEHGVDFRPLPASVLAALREASDALLGEIAAQDPFARRVYESYTAFRTQSRAWHTVSEQAYYQARG